MPPWLQRIIALMQAGGPDPGRASDVDLSDPNVQGDTPPWQRFPELVGGVPEREPGLVERREFLPEWLQAIAQGPEEVADFMMAVHPEKSTSMLMGSPDPYSAFASPRHNQISLGGRSNPFVAAHELGHIANIAGDMNPEGSPADSAFARRKQLQHLGEMFPPAARDFMVSQNREYVTTPPEVSASLIGSYLMYPDSVPQTTGSMQGIVGERGLQPDVDALRQILGWPAPTGRP